MNIRAPVRTNTVADWNFRRKPGKILACLEKKVKEFVAVY
jgi:hypothetical protein